MAKKTTPQAPVGKPAPRKAAPGKSSSNVKKAAPKKAAPAKAAPKKAAPRKPAAKQTAPKKAAPKKAAPRKAAAKQIAPKKAAPKKAAPRKVAPAKAAPAKAAPKKAAPVKPAPRKVAVKETAPKKAAPKPAAAKLAAPPARTAREAIEQLRRERMPASKGDVQRKRAEITTDKGTGPLPPPVGAQGIGGRKHKFIVEIDRPTGMYNGILLAENVKPFPKKTPYSQKEIDRLRDTLREERSRLINSLSSLQHASRSALDDTRDHPGYSVHMAEHATDLQTAEATLGVRSIEQERLELVEEALERIERNVNHYGLCLACGAKIGIQRLIARPHAHLCMDCRQRYEHIRSRRGL